jgi:hypothetical protein
MYFAFTGVVNRTCCKAGLAGRTPVCTVVNAASSAVVVDTRIWKSRGPRVWYGRMETPETGRTCPPASSTLTHWLVTPLVSQAVLVSSSNAPSGR